MKNLGQSLKLGLLVMGLVVVSACSSSKVEEGGAATETAAETNLDQPAEAVTDAVPGTDPGLDENTPDALAAKPEDIPGTDPSLEVPMGDATVITDNTVVSENPVVETPVVENPVVETPVADAPITENSVTPEPIVESAPVETPANSFASDATQYRVKKGDTLMKIAFEQYGDLYRWKEIYQANRENIKDPNHVPPGTQLTLNGAGMVTIERNGESYLIKRGDTLGVISNDVYGTTRKWKKLWENNRQLIKDPNKIYAGFYLYYIPEGKLTHEDVAPGLKKEDSAMNAPQVSTAPREPANAVTPDNSNPSKN